MKGAMTMANKTVTDCFTPYIGTKEYNGIVKTMITWFYGGFAPVAWCAIAVSYMMHEMGLLDQIGGKEQNTYQMMKNTEAVWKKTKKGTFSYAKDIKKGTVIKRGTIVWLNKDSGAMTYGGHKHTTTVNKDFTYTGSGSFESLGGNQDNYIKVKSYPQSIIYAMFYPKYEEHTTLRKGDKGAEVKELQQDLKALGFGRITGKRLLAGGSFKSNTENCVKAFQKYTGLAVDGVCGPKTWAKIDEMLATPISTTTAITNVYVRTGPGTEYKKTAKILEGVSVAYTNIIDGWMFIPKKNGWSMTKYYRL